MEEHGFDATKSVYQQVLNRIQEKPTSLPEKVRDEISRDLKRTHTSERMKMAEGQKELDHVLQAIAFVLPDVGYCQGMNFIASTLIASLRCKALIEKK